MTIANIWLQATDMRIDPGLALIDPPIDIAVSTAGQSLPVVLTSPHSGDLYPAEFLAASRLDAVAIRKSEDSFVDEIFGPAAALGAPLLKALFPRAYCDVNREPYELDPAMFVDALPAHANTRSVRVAGGLGTIARVVSSGEDIYRAKLTWAEAERRIRRYYRPYHTALADLVQSTRDRFGVCILIDCHSMPSLALPGDRARPGERPDIVLGDRFGTSCARAITDTAEDALARLGYRVGRNAPYAGGFTTSHYGRPSVGLHAMQIEINRSLYMDERTFLRLSSLESIARDMAAMLQRIVDAVRDEAVWSRDAAE